MDEAIDVANEIVPEHLTLSVDEPFDYLEKIRHAGRSSSGSIHSPIGRGLCCRPESRPADRRDGALLSALSVHDYIKVSNIVHYTREELSKVRDHLVRLAHIEGFDAHAESCPEQVLMKKNGSAPRQSSIHRATKEADIRVEWALDGSGQGKIDAGIRFFDHMLELLSKHGFFDLTVQAKGDIDIDEHHTVEDVGHRDEQALHQALGEKAGIRAVRVRPSAAGRDAGPGHRRSQQAGLTSSTTWRCRTGRSRRST